MTAVLAFNLLGDAWRDWLESTERDRRMAAIGIEPVGFVARVGKNAGLRDGRPALTGGR